MTDEADVVVRPYAGADRAQVRRICHETGYMGDPAGWFWRDVESFADMFSGYYTAREPESAFVVEIDGVACWFERLRAARIEGCHLQTMAENANAIAFFEAVGFRRFGGPQLIPGFRSPTGARHHIQTMVCDL